MEGLFELMVGITRFYAASLGLRPEARSVCHTRGNALPGPSGESIQAQMSGCGEISVTESRPEEGRERRGE